MRKVICLNRDWRFCREDAGVPEELPSGWAAVDLPHTWNAVDGHDGNGDYYRGRCWYAKCFETPRQPLPGGRVYLEILAAGQQAEVYVNGMREVIRPSGQILQSFAEKRGRIFWQSPAAMKKRAACIPRLRILPFTGDSTGA